MAMMHRDEGCNPMDGGRCGEGTVGGVGRSVNAFMNNIYLLPNFLHFAMLISAAALRGAYASVRVPPTRSGVN